MQEILPAFIATTNIKQDVKLYITLKIRKTFMGTFSLVIFISTALCTKCGELLQKYEYKNLYKIHNEF